MIQGILARITLWKHRAESRAELAELSTTQLRDIGVTPEQAEIEASKPFWR
ncbi:MAG: DUF1127 domain-containing protein [Pseudomonadota bacterium]